MKNVEVEIQAIIKNPKDAEKKIYVDSSFIIDPAKIKNFTEEEKRAIKIIKSRRDIFPKCFYTSEKTKEEIEKHKNSKKREVLLEEYDIIGKIPNENIIKFTSALFNAVMFNAATFNGSYSAENPLLIKLKTLFDKDDAEHIFQAEKSNMGFFLTLDKKTIIDRIIRKPNEFRKIGLRINIVSPVDLLNILEIKK